MRGDALRTNPEKKKLTQPIASICGTMVANWFFMSPIMPSIMAGSVREVIAVAVRVPEGQEGWAFPDIVATKAWHYNEKG